MTSEAAGIDRSLAVLLSRGTWLGSLVIAVGLVLPASRFGGNSAAERLVMAGIAIIVALPVLRVVLMGFAFLRAGERDFAVAAILVLAIIVLASAIGGAA